MTPFIATLDTGSGFNLIRSSILTKNMTDHVDTNFTDPALADANGHPLRIEGVILLRIRLGNAMFPVRFYVCSGLAVEVLLGTAFTNKYVKAIWCIDQRVTLRDESTIPILATHRHDTTNTTNSTTTLNDKIKSAAKVRLRKRLTLPPMSQTYAQVTTDIGGLATIEPRDHFVKTRGIRTANGIVDAVPRKAFTILLANTSSSVQALPKNAVVAYAVRSDQPVYSPAKHELTNELSNVMHIGAESNDTPSVIPVNVPHDNTGHDINQTLHRPVPTKEGEPPWQDSVDLGHVDDPSLRKRILEMLDSHSEMWTPGKLGEINVTEHQIELVPNSRAIRSQPYRQGPATREVVAKNIREMIEADVIEPAQSEWASPVVLVPKKDGTLRFCVDYRKLNAVTVSDTYPLPRIDDCIDSLGNATIFTTLDANSGYWQVPVAPEDRDKTTFTTFMGTFRHKRMPFGLRNAPATFQRALDMILSGVRWQTCLVYLDDVIVFSRNVQEHLSHVNEILTLLRNAGVTLKLKKCDFFRNKVNYLGYVITPGKLSVATKNTEAFAKAKFPTNITQLRSFLGAANVYRRFVKDFSKIAKPLSAMTQKDANPQWDDPTEMQLDAFETLKRKLVSPPVLALPMPNRPFLIDTDASAYQLGAALLQQQDDENPNDYVPVGYFSKTLSDTERNYSTTERECFAVVWSLLTLRPYLDGTRFYVRTDHDALKWLMTLNDPSGRLTRWRLRLAEFDFEIIYRPGRKHQVPDALSRLTKNDHDTHEVDDEIPTFGDHNKCYVTTRRTSPQPDNDTGLHETNDTHNRAEDPDYDEFADFIIDVDEDDEEADEQFDYEAILRALDIPSKISRDELCAAQRTDTFCNDVLARQSTKHDSLFFEDNDGLLKRRTRGPDPYIQVVVPLSLRTRILHLAHDPAIAGHPGETRMFETLRVNYYWPHMAADVHWYVHACRPCAKKRIKFRKTKRLMKLFPATTPLEFIAIDILGPLPRTRKKNRYLLVISDRFTKLTQVVALPRINAYTVAVAFCESWVFKYGAPKQLLSDNGKQFVAKLFQAVCKILGVSNVFTATYHPQTNGQVERYNRTILAMLRNYVNEHQNDWDHYAGALTYAYNSHVHRTTGTTPFSLVLSRPPEPFASYHSIRSIRKSKTTTEDDRRNLQYRLDVAISNAAIELKRQQERYKRDFDKHVDSRDLGLRVGDYVYIDPKGARLPNTEKRNKLQHNLLGPFKVLRLTERNVTIQRNDAVETMNIDRVVYSPPPDVQRVHHEHDATPEDLNEKNLAGETWLVERILNHRKTNNKYEFLIKWENDDRTTWEPRRNVPEELVSHYFSTTNNEHAPKRTKRRKGKR